MSTYQTSDFDYTLPEELIAQQPLPARSASRLLCLNRSQGGLRHCPFSEIVNVLDSRDLLIFNDTEVIPARLLGRKSTGGALECLIERLIDEHRVLAHLKASKSPKPGTRILLEDVLEVVVQGRQGELFELYFQSDRPVLGLLQEYGRLPLPPYIERSPDTHDAQRYQTVYAKKPGAVAAPTAGLHFDDALLEALKAKGVQMAHVTLHVGAGTFQPVRTENVSEHHMHSEYLEVSQSVCDAVKQCQARGGRVIAVGTTTVRCLETAARDGIIKPYQGDTDIFIYPGYEFRCVDGLLTNFHLPKSTLLMLVCAFAGYDGVMAAYREAVEARYRFFSYGDAMLLL